MASERPGATDMQGLRRHRLAYVRPAAWGEVLARAWDPVARDCLAHWAARGLPLVVTRQLPGVDGIALALAAPLAWNRRRIALRVPDDAIERFGEFPLAHAVLAQMPPAARATLGRALPRVEAIGAQPHVYGSHGWQALSGMPCVHEASDIDLWIGVEDAAVADAAADVLCAAPSGEPRLDGELVLPDGGAIAWREWANWRAGGMQGRVLVKRVDGPALEDAQKVLATWRRRAPAAAAGARA